MADLQRRPSRAVREQRAYRLVLGGGASVALAVVAFVLAVVGVIGYSLAFIAGVIALVCWLALRRTLGRS